MPVMCKTCGMCLILQWFAVLGLFFWNNGKEEKN
jgi:hypothetical protein